MWAISQRMAVLASGLLLLLAAGVPDAVAQSSGGACAACRGCVETERFAKTHGQTMRRWIKEAKAKGRKDFARKLERRARSLGETRERAAAALVACRKQMCGAGAAGNGVFRQCAVRPNLSGRWQTAAVQCRDGKNQTVQILDARPSYRLRVTAESCPRKGALIFDAVVGPTRYHLTASARSSAGRLRYNREDLAIINAGRMRLRGPGRKVSVRFTRLPAAGLSGDWRIVRPRHLAGSLLRIEQLGATVVARHVRPAPETARHYGYKEGHAAFKGALKGRVVKGRLRSRFPARLGRKCPDKLVRPVVFRLRVKRGGARLTGRYKRARLTTRDCEVAELADWNKFELKRVSTR